MPDERVAWVPVACGKCMECKRAKAREWRIRLNEEIQTDTTGKFVTLTFNQESLDKLKTEFQTDENNAIAKIAVRRFLERWRKKYKKSLKHWLVTELGHEGTERIHLHGFLFSNETESIKELWQYGFAYIGQYTNSRTINYCTKYVLKQDQDHKNYQQITLVSPGIGKGYLDKSNAKKNRFKGEKTNELYTMPNGTKTTLPIYYRNKIYSEEEREKLWLQKLDKMERWVNGIKIDISTKAGEKRYFRILQQEQKLNETLGFGNDSKEWKKESYNLSIKELQKKTKKNLHNSKKIL